MYHLIQIDSAARVEILKAPGEAGADGRLHAGIEQRLRGYGGARVVRSREMPGECGIFAHGQPVDCTNDVVGQGRRGLHVWILPLHRDVSIVAVAIAANAPNRRGVLGAEWR
jgi:hypothetical protein